jgi:peptidyl-tRNA hydrolase
VLQRFSKSEENAIEEVIKKATQALKTAIQEGLDKAKNQFN